MQPAGTDPAKPSNSTLQQFFVFANFTSENWPHMFLGLCLVSILPSPLCRCRRFRITTGWNSQHARFRTPPDQLPRPLPAVDPSPPGSTSGALPLRRGRPSTSAGRLTPLQPEPQPHLEGLPHHRGRGRLRGRPVTPRHGRPRHPPRNHGTGRCRPKLPRPPP